MRFLLFFIFSGLLSTYGHGASISQQGRYLEYCNIASDEPEEFVNFKRNPIYRCILEHTTKKQGLEYLKVILRDYPHLEDYFPKFRENDSLGNPITFHYSNYGKFSPTTLQYIRILGDIHKKFGKTSKLNVVEIGGGYGGQCKILHDYDGFSSYTIVDLQEPLKLTQRYLENFKINDVKFIKPDAIDSLKNFDLVISNYAFSEIDKEEQIQYLNKVINKSPMGYLLINFIHDFFGIKPLSLHELISYLDLPNRTIQIEKEKPATGPYNVVLSWKPCGTSEKVKE